MRNSITWVAAALAGAVLLVVTGCGGASASGGSSGATPDGASVVPASAPVFVTVDTDLSSGQWQAVDDLLDKFPGKADFLAYLRRELKQEGLSWDTDIEPALGDELDIAVLDFQSSYNVVGLLQPRDEGKFAALVQKAKQQDPETTIVYEKIGDWTVVSDDKTKIDVYRRQLAGAKLADDATFQDALARTADDALAKVYANGPELLEGLKEVVAEQPDADAQEAQCFTRLLETNGVKFDSATAQLVAEDDGVRLDGAINYASPQQTKPYKAALLDEVPAGALAYLSFNGSSLGLDKFDQNFESFANCSGSGVSLEEVRPFLQVVGKAATLLANENALYVRPGVGPIPEVTLVAQPDDPQAAMATVDELVAEIAKLANTTVAPQPITIGSVQAKELDFGEFSIFYGVRDGKLLVTDEQQAFEDLGGSGPRLSDDETFKEAVAASGMPDETTGFLYVNLKDTIPWVLSLARLGAGRVPPEVSENLRPLRTLTVWGAHEGTTTNFSLFMEVK